MAVQLPDNVKRDLFIGGEFVESSSGERFSTPNPATGKELTTIASANEADVDRAVANARETFNSGVWSALAPGERGSVLAKFAQLLSLIHISEPTRLYPKSRMPSSA